MNQQEIDDERKIAWLKLHALVNHPEKMEFDHGFNAGQLVGVMQERNRIKQALTVIAEEYIGNCLLEHFAELFPEGGSNEDT